MAKTAALSEKHWQAIQLIGEGKLSIKQIASVVGLKPNTLYKFSEGHNDTRETGQLFQAQIQKLSQEKLSQSTDLIRDNKVIALRMINDYLHRKASLEFVSDNDIKVIVSIYKALSKVTSGVEINRTLYSFAKGLSAEELLQEYNKFRTMVEGSSIPGKIPGPQDFS